MRRHEAQKDVSLVRMFCPATQTMFSRGRAVGHAICIKWVDVSHHFCAEICMQLNYVCEHRRCRRSELTVCRAVSTDWLEWLWLVIRFAISPAPAIFIFPLNWCVENSLLWVSVGRTCARLRITRMRWAATASKQQPQKRARATETAGGGKKVKHKMPPAVI